MLFHFATVFMLLASAAATAPIDLGTLCDYTVLGKAGITATPGTMIEGDMAASPITIAAITGFGLVASLDGTYSTSGIAGLSQVEGRVYGATSIAPTPAILTVAVSAFTAAHVDGMGRVPDAGNAAMPSPAADQVFTPGTYSWTAIYTVPVSTTLTFDGGPDDVWIMRIGTGLTFNSFSKMELINGARAQNIFWVLGTQATIGTYTEVQGIFLCGSACVLKDDAVFNGGMYAMTAVTMISNSGYRKSACFPDEVPEVVPAPAPVIEDDLCAMD